MCPEEVAEGTGSGAIDHDHSDELAAAIEVTLPYETQGVLPGMEVASDWDRRRYLNRGLLCNRHNTGLGHFRDSARELIRAARYVVADGRRPWTEDLDGILVEVRLFLKALVDGEGASPMDRALGRRVVNAEPGSGPVAFEGMPVPDRSDVLAFIGRPAAFVPFTIDLRPEDYEA